MSVRSIVDKSLALNNSRRNYIFINVLITCIAASLLTTSLTTALPAIVNEFGVSVSIGQWLTSGYFLIMAISMPLTAYLVTRIPTKRLYLVAIAVFIIGSITCLVAPVFSVMIVGRSLQAASSGVLIAMAQVIILTIFPIHKLGFVMGWYGLAIGVAPIIAPTIAGVLVDNGGWEMIFIIISVIMVITFISAIFVMEDVLDTYVSKFDFYSFILCILTFGGVTLSIGNLATYGFSNPIVYIPLIIGGISAILFIVTQLNLDEPLLDLRMVKDHDFRISLISSMILYLLMMGTTLILPLYLQQIKELSATHSGLALLPGALALAIISPFAGNIYDRIGIKRIFILGSLLIAISNIGMALITIETSLNIPIILNIIRNIGFGFLLMPLVTWGMENVRDSLTAHGTALLTSLRTVAGAIGPALFVSIMNSVAAQSANSHGDAAFMHGLNITFYTISGFSIVLLLLPILFIRSKKD
ncbi:MAG: DHA2 family efflux MFS transporter permease subunit [Erysipelotrichales bacterium]